MRTGSTSALALLLLWPALSGVLALLLAPIPAAAQAPTDSPSNAKPTVRVDWNPRPSLRFGDVLRIDFRLKIQSDLRAFSPDQPTENGTYELHRRRIGVEGRLFNRIEFQIEREMQEGGPWRDVYANVRVGEPFEVRVGKFKIPFGLEETTNTMDLDFIYRTRGSDELAPARDKGVMAHGRLGRLFEYEFGGFKGDGDNARVNEPVFLLPGESAPESGRTFAGRVVATPFGRGGGAKPRFGLAATSSTIAEGLNSLRGKTVFGSTFFHRMYVSGDRIRLGAEAEWKPGPFGLRGEYIRVTEERARQGLGDVDLSDLVEQAWYVSGTWVLTGERKSGGVEPRKSLLQGGAGAVEIGTRFESLRFSSASREGPAFDNPRADHVNPNQEQVWTTGVTWFMNRWLRIQGNAIRESFEDASRGPVADTPKFWSGVLRVQFVL